MLRIYLSSMHNFEILRNFIIYYDVFNYGHTTLAKYDLYNDLNDFFYIYKNKFFNKFIVWINNSFSASILII